MFPEVKPVKKINPRYRAYGRARLDAAQRAQTQSDWQRLWKPSPHPFPFVWGRHWKSCIEYQVDDFAAEVGFLIDVLGLPVNAFNPNIAMFTSPDHEFFFSVIPTPPNGTCTPSGTIRIQFMVDDLFATTEEFVRRGIVFENEPQPVSEGSQQWVSSFLTPNGMTIELWGQVLSEISAEKLEAGLAVREASSEYDADSQDDLKNTKQGYNRNEISRDYADLDADEKNETPLSQPIETIARKPDLLTKIGTPALAAEKDNPTKTAAVKPQAAESVQPVKNSASNSEWRNVTPLKTTEVTKETNPAIMPAPAARVRTAESETVRANTGIPGLTKAASGTTQVEKPVKVFRDGNEMLKHLQNKTSNPAPVVTTFRPAPKPASVPSLPPAEPFESEDLEPEQTKRNHYPLFSLDSGDEDAE